MSNDQQNAIEVVEQFCAEFPQQISDLMTHISEAPAGYDERRGFVRDLKAHLHRMSGATHCMGFRKVGMHLDASRRTLDALTEDEKFLTDAGLVELATELETVRSLSRVMRVEQSRLYKVLEDVPSEAEFPNVGLEIDQETSMGLLGRERILFADDDKFTRDFMELSLTSMGVGDVLVAESGEEVLDALKHFEPTLIITDWQMEPLDGISLLKKIRSDEASVAADTPVIFFTSMNQKEHIRQARKCGVNLLLGKPVLPQKIVEQILVVVEKRYRIRRRLAAVA